MDQDASPSCSADATSPMMTEPVPVSESDTDILPPPKTRKLEVLLHIERSFVQSGKKSSTLLQMFPEILTVKKFIGLFL